MRIAMLALIASVACTGDRVSRTIGARCDVTADCSDRCLQPSNDYPDGFCTLDCDADRGCPGDAFCVDREGGVCLFECFELGSARECAFLGPNWICVEQNRREDQNSKARVCLGN
jgi:hypothetical protein